MVKDLNRNITSIEYNSSNLRPKAVKIGCTSGKKEKTPLFSLLSTRFALSLPRQITFYDGTKMKLTYDAAGNKLRAEYWTIPTFNPGGPIGPASTVGGNEPMGGGIVGPILPPINQNDPQVVTDYCGNLIYRNDTLTMLLMEEGYVTFATSGTPTYHYYLKDHLGNVRIVMSQDGTVDQRNQYYPDGTLFGKQSTGGTVQPYKFGQKELERTLPLDEYDFGARWMDPTVGARFTTMDPLCEKYYSISPYAYCGNNPINFIDEHGDSITFIGSPEDINYAVGVFNNYLGFDYVQADENGVLSLNNDISPIAFANMGQGQKELFSMLRECVSYPGGMTTIGLVNNSENVLIGNASRRQIDVGDIQEITKQTQDKLPLNSTGTLSHEVYEQYQIQQKGMRVDFAHNEASKKESKIVQSLIPTGHRDMIGDNLVVSVYTPYNSILTHSINISFNRNNIQKITYKSY